MGRVKRIWYLSPIRAAKVQASLRIRAVSPEPPLLAHTSSESRGTFRQKARSLAPLNGWACAVKICHDGMLEDTNSLDGAHIFSSRSGFCFKNSSLYRSNKAWRVTTWALKLLFIWPHSRICLTVDKPYRSLSIQQWSNPLFSMADPEVLSDWSCQDSFMLSVLLVDLVEFKFNLLNCRSRVIRALLLAWLSCSRYVEIFHFQIQNYRCRSEDDQKWNSVLWYPVFVLFTVSLER